MNNIVYGQCVRCGGNLTSDHKCGSLHDKVTIHTDGAGVEAFTRNYEAMIAERDGLRARAEAAAARERDLTRFARMVAEHRDDVDEQGVAHCHWCCHPAPDHGNRCPKMAALDILATPPPPASREAAPEAVAFVKSVVLSGRTIIQHDPDAYERLVAAVAALDGAGEPPE